MKFHVGDRWADQWDGEWWVYDVSSEWAHAIDSDGESSMFSQETGERHENTIIGAERRCLTRLISSERWIPFVEMMPEHTVPGDKRALLASRVGFEPYILSRTGTEARWICWRNRDETDYDTLDGLIVDGVTHWKYLQPPEAP